MDETTEKFIPHFLSSFVGRSQEIDELSRLLAENRSVCLVGPGGVGKTRLSSVVAERLNGSFRDGVITVDLNGVVCKKDFAYKVGASIGLLDDQARTFRTILGVLRPQQILLVLDGCEMLDAESVSGVQTLLEATDHVSILATSRRALYLQVSYTLTLAPLAVPPTGMSQLCDPSVIQEYDAVRLFLDRAQLVRPFFALTEGNVESVKTLCQYLDGLPLAIEFAASWMRSLTVEQVVDRFEERPAFFQAGMTDVVSRNTTLDFLLADTYDLCSPEEQILWSRMAIFEESFDINAVEAVCNAPPLNDVDLLVVLTSLLDKSVLTVDHSRHQSRYQLLRIARSFISSQGHDVTDTVERYRKYFSTMVTTALDGWSGPNQTTLMEELSIDYPNIIRGIEYGIEDATTAPQAINCAADLWPFWITFGRITEGRRLLQKSLDVLQTTASSLERSRGLLTNAYLCVLQGDVDAARTLNNAALAGHEQDVLGRGQACLIEAMIEVSCDRWQTAADLLNYALACFIQIRDPRGTVLLLEALSVAAASAALKGDTLHANALVRRGLKICDENGDVVWRGYLLYAYGLDAWLRDDFGKAIQAALEAISGSPDELLVTHCIELLAWCATRTGRYERAAKLFGAADRRWLFLGGRFSGFKSISRHRDTCQTLTRSVLGPAVFETAHRQGATLMLANIAYAAEEELTGMPQITASRDTKATPLTQREFEVAHLLANGASNREIALALHISQRTAESHVGNILAKLELTNRTQVARWMHRLGYSAGS